MDYLAGKRHHQVSTHLSLWFIKQHFTQNEPQWTYQLHYPQWIVPYFKLWYLWHYEIWAYRIRIIGYRTKKRIDNRKVPTQKEALNSHVLRCLRLFLFQLTCSTFKETMESESFELVTFMYITTKCLILDFILQVATPIILECILFIPLLCGVHYIIDSNFNFITKKQNFCLEERK